MMKKIIITLAIVITIIGVFVGINFKKQMDYNNKYKNLYNEYYNKFVQVFCVEGEPDYSDNGKLKIKNAKLPSIILAKKIKILENGGIAVNNYFDFFENYYNDNDNYNHTKFALNIFETYSSVMQEVDKLNMGLNFYNDTNTPEVLNNWLDKAVKEYILREYELSPPKGF